MVQVQLSSSKRSSNQKETLAQRIIDEAHLQGVVEFSICPGGRNAAFVKALKETKGVTTHYWYEERSAAFFALGRSRATKSPVAIITTSGTAVGELLPAVMEAYHLGVPLLLITADRPRRFRGTGSPQTCDQVGLFTSYVEGALDLEGEEPCSLSSWTKRAPFHLNSCFEEEGGRASPLPFFGAFPQKRGAMEGLIPFLKQVKYPLVVVSTLPEDARASVLSFLESLRAPTLIEAVSGLREEPRLSQFRITEAEGIWERARNGGYPIDGILRIGGIPTHRLWRDLEELEGNVSVCSVSHLPFSGVSWVTTMPLPLTVLQERLNFGNSYPAETWLKQDRHGYRLRLRTYFEKRRNEPALIHSLSSKIPEGSHVYLGNSLPIRHWDAHATWESRGYRITASRGLNGIDGQVSTFLGLAEAGRENWALLGDLTTLYDLAGFWILPKLDEVTCRIVVVNNSGGKIFQGKFAEEEFQNAHTLSFAPLATLWGIEYQRWNTIPDRFDLKKKCLIELIPNEPLPHSC